MPTVSSTKEASYYQQVRTQEEKSKMGKEDFLKILVTQLTHQDPLQPLQDREFIAQMTQFSTLEQMVNLNQSFADFVKFQHGLSAFAPMIGKEVSWLSEETDETMTGEVSGVTMKDGNILYLINGEEIPVENVIKVTTGVNKGE